MYLNVRASRVTDQEAACAICDATLDASHPYRYDQYINSPGTFTIVAEVDGRVVGFVYALIQRQDPAGPRLWQRLSPYIAYVAVLPEYQRRGVATTLVKAMLSALIDYFRFGPTVWLECEAGSGEMHLYEKVGFKEVPPDEVKQIAGLPPLKVAMRFDQGPV